VAHSAVSDVVKPNTSVILCIMWFRYREKRRTSSQPVHETVAPNHPAFTVISPVFDAQAGYDELNLIKNETYDDHADAVAAQAAVPNPYQSFDKASSTKA